MNERDQRAEPRSSRSASTGDNVRSEVAAAGDRDASPLRLDQQQQRLVEVFAAQDQAATAIYLGALTVLADYRNPDRLALAAHGVRELIRLIPNCFDALPVERTGRLGDKVRVLHEAWILETERATSPDDPPSPKFVMKLRAFFEWWHKHHPKQKDVTAHLLRLLDPSSRPLPGPVQDERVAEWRTIRDYFVQVAHHGQTTEDEFNDRLDAFERFLLGLVRPRTFENAARLDKLIAEAEGA